MSLAGRILRFLLIALGLILAGFSVALFLLAIGYLYTQMDGRLDATLDVLSAAAEVEPDRVEWDPVQHQVASIGQGRWAVFDAHGNIVSRSIDITGIDFKALDNAWERDSPDKTRRANLEEVRIAYRRVVGAGQPRSEPLDHDEYDALILVAAAPVQPVQASLRMLGLALAVLSIVLWLLTALVGRRLCRKGLAPLAEMAHAAEVIQADDFHQRLPNPKTGDELEALCGAFNGLLDRLQESFEQQRRFTGDASHQLRTPLTVLLGQVEVARRRDRTAEEYRTVLDTVYEEGRRLKDIIETLLCLARPDAEGLHAEMRPIDLADWLYTYFAKWAHHARGHDIQRHVGPSADLVMHANPALLAQVLDNLIENAAKYSEPGTPILVRAVRRGKDIALGVVDCGMGLEVGEEALVFKPFFRTPRARASGKPGVGLGLAMVQRLVELQGGTIHVHSKQGQGCAFEMLFPSRAAT